MNFPFSSFLLLKSPAFDKRIFLFSFCLLFILVKGYSQSHDSKIDSIGTALQTSSGREKVDLLLRLARIYREIDTDSLLNNARRAYKLSRESNYSKGCANSILLMGRAHHDVAKVSEAREYYFQALHLFEKLEDKKGIANVYNSLGTSYMEYGDYKKAVEYLSESLLLNQQIQDKQALANSYNNIGNAYAGQANYYLSLNNHLKGLALKEEKNDTSKYGINGLAMSYLNIGRLYVTIQDLKRAHEFLNKAEKLFEQIDNKGGLILVFGALGGIYDTQNEYDKAIDAYLKAIEITKQLGYEDGELSDNYMRIGYTHYKRALKSDGGKRKKHENKDYDIAFNYANRALEISKKLNYEMNIVSSYLLMGNLYRQWGEYENSLKSFNKILEYNIVRGNKIALYEGLYLLRLDQKDYPGALNYYTMYTNLKDSVYNTQTTLKNIQLGNTYEEEKKEKIRELTNRMKELAHEEEIKRQRTIQLSILIGLFLVAVFAAFVYRSYRQKQKANIIITKQKSEVEQAYKIIEEQKKIVDEHNKDITDSINYARRIQTALLASDSLLDKNLSECFVLYKPKDIVSGDFYWASEINDAGKKQFVLCVGDCTGHGVPGAFMSLLNISKLNETINEKRIVKPDHILNTVREEIIKALNPENADEECNDGMDCTICSFEFYESKLEGVEKGYANFSYAAANNPFYLIRDNELIVGKADKIPVGKSLREKEAFSFHSLELKKGDLVYLLTDGYADQFGGQKGKKFKYKQLEELLLSIHQQPMNSQKAVLNQTMEKWKGANEQVDDILIVGIRV